MFAAPAEELPYSITVNYITPTTAGITVNGVPYTMYLGQFQRLGSSYIGLTYLSYLPIEQTVNMDLLSLFPVNSATLSTTSILTTIFAPNTTTILPITILPITSPGSVNAMVVVVNATPTVPAVVNFTSSNATFEFYAMLGTNGKISVNIENIKKSIVTPQGAYTISAVNITSEQLSRIEEIFKYPCGINSSTLTPYVVSDGTWHKISSYTINKPSCTIAFATNGSNAVIALIYGQLPNSSWPAEYTYIIIGALVVALACIAWVIKRHHRVTRQGLIDSITARRPPGSSQA